MAKQKEHIKPKSAKATNADSKLSKFGLIPHGWQIKKVSEIFQFLSTNSFSRANLNYEISENSIYNIHYGDIHATYNEPILDFDKEKSIPVLLPEMELTNSVNFLKDGDLIIADASEDYEGVGVSIELKNVKRKKVVSGLHTLALRDNKNQTLPGFRTYLLKNPIVSNAIKVIATGSKVHGISKTNLSNLYLIVPPLPEQKKIAAILAKWEEGIALTQNLIDKNEEQKRAFVDLLLTGKVRFKEFSNIWTKGEFGQYVTRPKNTIDPRTSKEIFPCIELENINQVSGSINGYVLSSELNSIKNRFSKGQILFGKLRPYLKKYWRAEYEGLCSSEIWVLNGVKNKMTNAFLFYFVQQHKFISVANATCGSKMPRADWEYISGFPYSFPGIQEQNKISDFIKHFDENIELLKYQVSYLKKQKSGLMQQLLTGKIRVKLKKI